ncbi:hypothetical protein [Micavibrio aeruginosavorus]|uniref:hypothetical protein n=1 Tax=Micavibrio aeruginosavorus TaxID=349221 RepID=UPI003F4ACEC7
MSDSNPKTEIELLKDVMAKRETRYLRLLGLSFMITFAGVAGTKYFKNEAEDLQKSNADLSAQNTVLAAENSRLQGVEQDNAMLQQSIALHRAADDTSTLILKADQMAKDTVALCQKENSKGRWTHDETAIFVEGMGSYYQRQRVPVSETLAMLDYLQQNNIRVLERNDLGHAGGVLAHLFNSPTYGKAIAVQYMTFGDGLTALRALVADMQAGTLNVPEGRGLVVVKEEQDDQKAYPEGYKITRIDVPLGSDKIVLNKDGTDYRVKIATRPCPQ